MDTYPQNLIDQYLKTSSKLKKFDRVFKRFGPSVPEVLGEFQQLAYKFNEAGINQYAAMCHLGAAKCEKSMGDNVSEVQSYLKSARCFLSADSNVEALLFRSNKREYIEGALKSYQLALESCTDDGVMKAAIIREIRQVQPKFDDTSSFASPCHRIYELELSAQRCLEHDDYFTALEQLTDIVDNIYERKKHDLYDVVLRRVEILRLLLLLFLNLPPARQSPSHIKLIEYFYNFENTSLEDCWSGFVGEFIPLEMKYYLANIVILWCEHKKEELKNALKQFDHEFTSLNTSHRLVIDAICNNIDINSF